MSFLFNKVKSKIKDKVRDAAGDLLNYLGDDEVDESELPFLHGRLKVHIIEAEGLPDTDTALWNIDRKDMTDAYVTGDLGQARLFKTKYIPNELNPRWDESFNLYVCHHAQTFEIRVKDKEHIGANFIASCDVPAQDLLNGEAMEGWYDLVDANGENQGKINLTVQFIPKSEEVADTKEVPDAYFPVRENNRVKLYQDAETPQLPCFDAVVSPDGSPYIPTNAWKDLYEAISNAEKFIYITGWSVYTEIKLLRGDDDPDGASHVGELLKRKADEGVRVLLMVWDEKLSTDSSPGLMGTHDQDTRRYFDGTPVECVLVPRAKAREYLASEFVSTCYTHHQKTVICDAADEDSGLRRIVAFIGGLDITDGRYDTPEHQLYATLHTKHEGDFYNNCVLGTTVDVGPREPWHDDHAMVQGPAALDIMKNFEERWCKQSEDRVTSLIHLHDDEYALDASGPIPDNEAGPWNVQLFRSITSDSCVFDLDKMCHCHSKGGRIVEDTIMRAMVHKIRNAKNFIYMENQYFLGSAYAWYNDKDTLTHHIIPREIVAKICDKIASGEDFHCYVLIPMFPEGDPASAAIQEILFWQFRTMETMYRRIAKCIQQHDAGTHPTDYLSFYCLAKRESPDDLPEGLADPEPGSGAEKVRQSMRHCIYVHSKMSIFDDDYVIIGSANINQRSLGGNRDSEIAIGAWQPGFTVEEAGEARGGVHTFRMALWAEHFNGADEAFLNPQSRECVDKVREISRGYWEAYTADEPTHCDTHALPYPVQVEEDGQVSSLESPWDCFPDTEAPVLGKKSGYLPGKLTT